MFIDLAGFTALTEAHGDRKAVEVLDEFERLVRAAIAQHGLREVKTIGDAFLVTGDSPAAAVGAALDVIGMVGRRDDYPDVRIGIHAGEVIERDGDVIGGTVNLAARVAAEAAAGHILVTGALASADLGEAVATVPLGRRRLRNIHDEVELFEVTTPDSARVVDPVCRMTVGEPIDRFTVEHAEITYHFCSDGCKQRFVTDPAAFI